MILNGWKEVANYMGRGVRTVQRWERLGLPVRRPNERLRSAIVADSAMLDLWLSRLGDGRTRMTLVPREAPPPLERIDEMRRQCTRLRSNCARLHAIYARSEAILQSRSHRHLQKAA